MISRNKEEELLALLIHFTKEIYLKKLQKKLLAMKE